MKNLRRALRRYYSWCLKANRNGLSIICVLFIFLQVLLASCSDFQANDKIRQNEALTDSIEGNGSKDKRSFVGVWVTQRRLDGKHFEFNRFAVITASQRFWMFSFDGDHYLKYEDLPIVNQIIATSENDTIAKWELIGDSLFLNIKNESKYVCEKWEDEPSEFISTYLKRDSVKQLLSGDWQYCKTNSSDNEIGFFGTFDEGSMLHFGTSNTEIWIQSPEGKLTSKKLTYCAYSDKFGINEDLYVLGEYPIYRITADSFFMKNSKFEKQPYTLAFSKVN